MLRYMIDTDDGTYRTTGEAFELEDRVAARQAVLASLPDLARDVMPDGDQRVIKVTATDEAGRIVYSATLTLDGKWGP